VYNNDISPRTLHTIHHTDESTSENTMNHILNWQQWQLTHLSEKCPWTYTSTRGHCCLWSICTAKCHWQQTAATQGKSANKKWCKYGVMRTRLQCTQFLCARACIKNRSGKKWQKWDSDHFLGKFVVCGYDPQQFRTLEPNFFSEVSPHTCMRTDSGDFDNWDPLYFRRFTLQDHMHDEPLSTMISIYHWLQWSLWPWSLTVSYNNCKCLNHLFPSAASVNTRMCGLYPSQQLIVWCYLVP